VLLLAQLAQLLDLGYTHLDLIAGAWDALDVHRQCPTASGFCHPGKQGVGIAYPDGAAINGRA
jgi:hypothetical protein